MYVSNGKKFTATNIFNKLIIYIRNFSSFIQMTLAVKIIFL